MRITKELFRLHSNIFFENIRYGISSKIEVIAWRKSSHAFLRVQHKIRCIDSNWIKGSFRNKEEGVTDAQTQHNGPELQLIRQNNVPLP